MKNFYYIYFLVGLWSGTLFAEDDKETNKLRFEEEWPELYSAVRQQPLRLTAKEVAGLEQAQLEELLSNFDFPVKHLLREQVHALSDAWLVRVWSRKGFPIAFLSDSQVEKVGLEEGFPVEQLTSEQVEGMSLALLKEIVVLPLFPVKHLWPGQIQALEYAQLKTVKHRGDFALQHLTAKQKRDLENGELIEGKAAAGFEGSEAEALLMGFIRRTALEERMFWLNEVAVDKKVTNIAFRHPPEGFFWRLEKRQELESLILALTTEANKRHFAFTETPDAVVIAQNFVERLSEDVKSELVVALGWVEGIELVKQDINPVFEERPLTRQQREKIERLTRRIHDDIEYLNKQSRNGYFVNEAHRKDSRNFYIIDGHREGGGLSIHHRFYDERNLRGVLKNIRSQNERLFIEKMVNLATGFPRHLLGAKESFIQTFSVLYVTFNFISEGVAIDYFHFLLRCGEVK